MSDTTLKLKDNWRALAADWNDTRPATRIRAHYLLERELATQLLKSSSGERTELYRKLYDELFAKLPDHPQHTREPAQDDAVQSQIELLTNLVPEGARFAEIGAGDCRVTVGLAPHCSSVTAIDVSDLVQSAEERPANFSFVKIDGKHLPFPENSLDFIYSNQLMEHLHPDDAFEQIHEIYRVLSPGGVYFCVTPHAFTGPHDVSRYFDDKPTGFHLKEYRYAELTRLFREAGFARSAIVWARRSGHMVVQTRLGILIESILEGPLSSLRGRLASVSKIRGLLGIMILGFKDGR